MSARGMDFLELWMERHLEATGGSAVDLAQRCIAEASAGGISREEIEQEAGPLEAFIAAALDHPANGDDLITDMDD